MAVAAAELQASHSHKLRVRVSAALSTLIATIQTQLVAQLQLSGSRMATSHQSGAFSPLNSAILNNSSQAPASFLLLDKEVLEEVLGLRPTSNPNTCSQRTGNSQILQAEWAVRAMAYSQSSKARRSNLRLEELALVAPLQLPGPWVTVSSHHSKTSNQASLAPMDCKT